MTEQHYEMIIDNIDQYHDDIMTEHFNFIRTLKFEYWSLINDFPNYEVSTFGNVKNIKTGRILQPGIDTSGYYTVSLYKDKKSHPCNVHRLVAKQLLKTVDGKTCVDHIDNNKLNNHIKNLRYATCSENSYNTKINKCNTSGIKGIYWNKSHKKWHVQITLIKKMHIGFFDNLEDAKRANEEARLRLHGEYANNG